MANDSGVSRYRISMLINRKPGTDTPRLDFDDILTLVKYIKNNKNSAEVLNSLDEDSKFLLDVFDGHAGSELVRRSSSIEVSDEVLEDFDNLVILVLASGDTTLADIESNLLPHNQYKIEDLIQRDIIENSAMKDRD